MKHILITGSKGQLGSEIHNLSVKFPEFTFAFTDVDELDITDKNTLELYTTNHPVDAIVNCAAYTAVDKAEEDFSTALKINHLATNNLAEIAERKGIVFIHISTDYVFNGMNHKPYIETDPTNPVSAYGKSKLKGEQVIREKDITALIIRTSWLYSKYGRNFVKSMLSYGREKEQLKVVFDQVGNPTNAADLAKTILQILQQENKIIPEPTIYHYSNEGVCSWYDFAKEIMEISGIYCPVIPIESKDYPLPAARPHYSVLNKARIKSHFNLEIPHWKDSLKRCLQELIKN